MLDLELEGATELTNLLNLLPIELRKKALGHALREGTKVMHEEIKHIAPVGVRDKKGMFPHKAGQLKKHLAVRAMKRKGNRMGFRVTIRNSERFVTTTMAGKRHFYPAVVEYGDATHEPNPFMRIGFERSKDGAVRVVRRLLERDVISTAKGLGLVRRRRAKRK